jgi:purine-binding chemotaxis protein CheW
VSGSGFVLFRLGERVFATALDDVREIVRLRGLQRLPGTRLPLAGTILLRGTPLPVLDVRGSQPALGDEPYDGSEPGDCGDVLVVADPDGAVGVAVDAVVAVLHPDELPPSGAAPSPVLPGYVVGVRTASDGPVLEVDLRALLNAEERALQT